MPVYRAGEENSQLYIAMRFVEGTDLQVLLRDGALAPPRAAAIVAQIGEALDAAHARGLIHRDVKPANVLVAVSAAASRPTSRTSAMSTPSSAWTGTVLLPTVQRHGVVPRIAPEELDRPCVGAVEPEKDTDRRRLPGAVRPQEPVHLTRLDREIQAVERARRAERLHQPGDGDRRCHAHTAVCMTSSTLPSGSDTIALDVPGP